MISKHSTRRKLERLAPMASGFALITTISILVLLALVAVGLLSLSTVTIRAGAQSTAKSQAQANARMALILAIGQLQERLGPDQRISAPSNLLDSNAETVKVDGVSQKHLTGAWRSWKWHAGENAPNYDQKKDSDFLGWLVSSPDQDALEDRDYVQSGPENPVTLVGPGTSLEKDDHVHASLIEIEGRNGFESSVAWAVFDEGQKARVSLNPPEPQSAASRIHQLTAPSLPGYDTTNNWEPIEEAESPAHTLTLESLALLGVDPEDDSTFHSLSPYSSNLLTDVAEGGFSQDLNLLFDRDSLPGEFDFAYLYSGEQEPLAPAPTRFNRANAIPAPDPTWNILHSHYRMYDRIQKTEAGYTVAVTEDERPRYLSGNREPFFNRQQLLPVVSKAQFVFSLSAGWHTTFNFWPVKQMAQRDKDYKYVGWFVTDPVITLWNPYNVSLRFSESEIELYRIPLRFQIFQNGQALGGTGTHFANLFSNRNQTGDWDRRKNQFYKLNLLPKPGEEEIVLKPGEHKVFTPHNHAFHWNQLYATRGLDLRPGFYPPEGNDSHPLYVGGATSLNMIIDDSGNPNNSWEGHRIPCPLLKVGDVLEVAVTADKANIDSFSETNRREISFFTKFYQGTGAQKRLIGGVELDYSEEEMARHLPTYGPDELSNFIVPPDIPEGVKADGNASSASTVANKFKRPFLIASLHLKTEQDSNYPSRSWLQNSPTNTYATTGLDQTEPHTAHQYEFSWEPMYDWKDIPGVQLDTLDRGYGGSGLYSDSGVHVTPFASLPLVPPISMAQLRHAPLNSHGQLPLTTQIVANSLACPLVDRSQVSTPGPIGTYLDHSFLANNRLFDHYFMSSATTQDTSLHFPERSLEEVLDDFFTGRSRLPNPRFRPARVPGRDLQELGAELATDENGFRSIGSSLYLDGAFNVNSTSLNAWKAFLASGTMESMPVLDALSAELAEVQSTGTMVSRQHPPTGEALSGNGAGDEILRWSGHRRLGPQEITELAEAAIEEVKKRGPFQSVAEFVNRRLEGGELGLNGALQAAIDSSGINRDMESYGYAVGSAGESFADPEAARGSTVDGSPTTINQADLLTPLAPYLSVRSDTFRIRAYGEARDAGGQVTKAWCEAVVQRTPQYLDPGEDEALARLPANSVNAQFGRRIRVVSFRWLHPDNV